MRDIRTTEHRVHFSNAQDMNELPDDSVELVVTSPPYPMIEMWDDAFSALNPEINECLSAANSLDTFELMHAELDKVWREVQRVLVPGGIACVNVGDATRKLGETFQLFPNHARITDFFCNNGFVQLPGVLWRKPTNKASKFMGSGMLPPNAYVTLEHEHILVFRNGGESRAFESNTGRRYESAYFWEERNQWYSDVWTDIRGTSQDAGLDNGVRERSAAYPLELPYRLINMYSVYGDTVLDPFWGTGTTTIAAMICARRSVGYELDESFRDAFNERVETVEAHTRERNRERLAAHDAFMENTERDFQYESRTYGVPVTTKQEKDIQFYDVDRVEEQENGFTVQHVPHEKS